MLSDFVLNAFQHSGTLKLDAFKLGMYSCCLKIRFSKNHKNQSV